MQAIILAAGMGKRLGYLTQDVTKCMVRVNGVTLIERMLRQLDALELSRVILVVGYKADVLVSFVSSLQIKTPVIFVRNDVYDQTNNIYSLYLARNYCEEEDTLLLESDLIFEPRALRLLVDDPAPSLALVAAYESWMDGTMVTIGEDRSILRFVDKDQFLFSDKNEYYKTVNIYKLSQRFLKEKYVPFLSAYCQAMGRNEYYEQVLKVIVNLREPEIKALPVNDLVWYEIDDLQDLDIASSIFITDPEEKLACMQKRYGGYWRYPKLLDFCYLVNPYFPGQKMMDEIKSNFDRLLTQYPSGLSVIDLIAAKDFGIRQEHMLVGNGAAELIGCLLRTFIGKVGFIRPTFEEYPNRYSEVESVFYTTLPENDYRYSADDLMNFFADKDLAALVLIDPDNPSGNYISHADVLRLCGWCQTNGICLILDESFADFADETENSCINYTILEKFDHLCVIKSISKSFGVPGLRLGVLASMDAELVANVRRELPIWNINSFAEFYLQIYSKYEKEYRSALVKIKQTRSRFIEGLNAINGLRVLPSQANYLMVEITKDISAHDLTLRLLQDDILIKDLTPKCSNTTRQFIRLAVRNEEENGVLIKALQRHLHVLP